MKFINTTYLTLCLLPLNAGAIFAQTLDTQIEIKTDTKTTDGQLVAKGGTAISLVAEGEKLMSQGNKNAITTEIPRVGAEFTEKQWKDFAKQFKGEVKKDKKAGEYIVDNALSAGLGGANTVDMYTKFTQVGDNTLVTLWIDLGGVYVNSKDFKDSKYAEAERILVQFRQTVLVKNAQVLSETEGDNLKDMQKAQKRLEGKNTDLKKSIEDYKEKIKKAEADIQKNEEEQVSQKAKIDAQIQLTKEIQKKIDLLKN